MPQTPSLSLRCTEHLVPAGGPELTSFLSGARVVDPGRDNIVAWLATTEYVPGTGGTHAQPRLAGIPASQGRDPNLAAFVLGLRGILPMPSPRTMSMAAVVPLVMAPGPTYASDVSTEETSGGEATAQEATEDPSVEEQLNSPSVASHPVAPAVEDDLSYQGDHLWEAVRGARVALVLDDELTITGTVLAHLADEIAIASEPDGTVMRVPKTLVMGMRLLATGPGSMLAGPPEVEEPPPGGRSLAVAGGVLTGIGATMMTTFAIGTAVDSSFPYYGFPLMLIGPALLAPGIPILTAGLVREERRHEFTVDRELQVTTGPIRGGWSGALSISF